jgi:hypothetical protein
MAWRVMMPKKIPDHVQPRAARRGEVQGDPLILWFREPRADLGMLVRAVVAQHDMKVRAGAAATFFRNRRNS